MNYFDCCCDCCDCCSMTGCCCPDCYIAGMDYSLPNMTINPAELIQAGNGLAWDGNTLNVTIVGGSGYTLPTATESVKGGIKVGHSLLMNGEGNEVMNVALDTTSSTVEGFMWINDVAETQSSVYDDAINDIWGDSSTGDNTSYDPDWDDKLNDIFS